MLLVVWVGLKLYYTNTQHLKNQLIFWNEKIDSVNGKMSLILLQEFCEINCLIQERFPLQRSTIKNKYSDLNFSKLTGETFCPAPNVSITHAVEALRCHINLRKWTKTRDSERHTVALTVLNLIWAEILLQILSLSVYLQPSDTEVWPTGHLGTQDEYSLSSITGVHRYTLSTCALQDFP